MPSFIFTNYAQKKLYKLDKVSQQKIIDKLKFLQKDEAFDHNCEALQNMGLATHRIRIGQFRAILQCDFETQKHRIIDIGPRKDIYQ